MSRWYIIHAYSGFENKVSESLKARAEAFGFAEKLGQVLIPTEEVVELRNGKKVTSKRMLYPGYVLVQMAMDDELWHHVKNTPRVTGFVGGGSTPVPLTADELDFSKFDYKPKEYSDASQLVADLDANVAEAVEILSNVSNETMAGNWTMRNGEQIYFTMPKAAVMRTFVMNQIIHHRGQLSVYLPLLDIPLPSIYGPSADEQTM